VTKDEVAGGAEGAAGSGAAAGAAIAVAVAVAAGAAAAVAAGVAESVELCPPPQALTPAITKIHANRAAVAVPEYVIVTCSTAV
jgi:hypothetical protein